MALYGYARVSTTDQNLDRQIDMLMEQGVPKENIFCEKMSGTKSNRPQLKALIQAVEENDVIYIESLSRLGRSSDDLIHLMGIFLDEKVQLISLKEHLDFSSSTGKMLAQLMAILAEFERNCIRERCIEGLKSAKARGRIGGRPKIPLKTIEKAKAMYEAGNLSIYEICKLVGISRPSFYKYVINSDENKKAN